MQAGFMPTHERRHGEPAIPPRLENYLNADQLRALHQIENFGWHIAFLRRPLFQTPMAVLQDSDHPDHYAVMLEDGEVDFTPDLTLRA